MKNKKLSEIIDECCLEYYGLSLAQINEGTRKGEVVKCRQMNHYLKHSEKKYDDILEYSLRQIGVFGDKDHATVLHSSKTVVNYLDIKDKQVKEDYEAIMQMIDDRFAAWESCDCFMGIMTNPNSHEVQINKSDDIKHVNFEYFQMFNYCPDCGKELDIKKVWNGLI